MIFLCFESSLYWIFLCLVTLAPPPLTPPPPPGLQPELHLLLVVSCPVSLLGGLSLPRPHLSAQRTWARSRQSRQTLLGGNLTPLLCASIHQWGGEERRWLKKQLFQSLAWNLFHETVLSWVVSYGPSVRRMLATCRLSGVRTAAISMLTFIYFYENRCSGFGNIML